MISFRIRQVHGLFYKLKSKFSVNFENTKQADHILEQPGLGLFCDYCFIKKILLDLGCQVNAANYF